MLRTKCEVDYTIARISIGLPLMADTTGRASSLLSLFLLSSSLLHPFFHLRFFRLPLSQLWCHPPVSICTSSAHRHGHECVAISTLMSSSPHRFSRWLYQLRDSSDEPIRKSTDPPEWHVANKEATIPSPPGVYHLLQTPAESMPNASTLPVLKLPNETRYYPQSRQQQNHSLILHTNTKTKNNLSTHSQPRGQSRELNPEKLKSSTSPSIPRTDNTCLELLAQSGALDEISKSLAAAEEPG